MFTIRVAIVAALVGAAFELLAPPLCAQYSQGSQGLRRAAEQYDERGRGGSKAVTVDGRLGVAPANGAVSYSYPIASRTIDGFPMEVRLNYCSAVPFTAYTEYNNGSELDPQTRWARFSQNRPAWVLGVNGFAVQVLSSATSFHAPSRDRSGVTSFSDADVVWTIDGYDVCNRMENLILGSASEATTFVDVIKLLRDDGSVLELLNVKRHNSTVPTNRPELYTGHYYVNEPNARGYGIVEFDSTLWPEHIRSYADNAQRYSAPKYPFIPRRLRYFPGDGLEYLFREWIAPNGLQPYADPYSRFGGMFAGPTIFYLEEIRSNGSLVAYLSRSRHLPEYIDDSSVLHRDSTRGRALFTDLFGVCHVEYGTRTMIVEALGRTTRVVFDVASPSGSATATESVPLAQFGYLNRWSTGLAALPENDIPYTSFVGYVTQIADPEGRVTRFTYEDYTRRFRGFGFPLEDSRASLALRNKRLTRIDEPTTVYEICYQSGDVRTTASSGGCTEIPSDETLVYGSESAENPSALNNMAREVRKYQLDGTLLTTDRYEWSDFDRSTAMLRGATLVSMDNLAGTRRISRYSFRRTLLGSALPFTPGSAFTELVAIEEEAADVRTRTETTYSRPTTSDFLWLPSAITVHVNGARKSLQRFEYRTDTVRRYGDETGLTSSFGREITCRIARTYGSGDRLLAVDSVYFAHFPLRDTTVTRTDSVWKKRQSMARFIALKDSHPDLIGRRWEDVMYHPAVAWYELDTITDRTQRTPVYALERRLVIADSTGAVLAGSARLYSGSVDPLACDRFAGLILADSIIGRGGITVVSAHHQYGDGWLRNLRTGTTNANGARSIAEYGVSAAWRDTGDGSPSDAAAMVLDNADSVTAHRFDGISAHVVESPHADLALIRRGAPLRPVFIDTLVKRYERTYFGQVSGATDENGWYSRYRYDRNGRLLGVWYPGDFPTSSRADTFFVEGADSIELYGYTRYTRRIDTLACLIAQTNPPTYPRAVGSASSNVVSADPLRLYAGLPVLGRPRCPCGDTAIALPEKSAPHLLQNCRDTILFESVGSEGGFTGHLDIQVHERSLFRSLVRLDSALLRFRVSDIEGECVTATFTIPRFGFSQSVRFNCDDPKWIADQRASGGALLMGGASGTDTGSRVDEGPYLDISLNSIISGLSSLTLGDTFGIVISVRTAGGGIRLSSGAEGADVRPRLILFGRFRSVGETQDYTLAYEHDDNALSTQVLAKTDDLTHAIAPWTVDRCHPDIRRSTITNFFGADFRHLLSEITIGAPAVPTRIDTVSIEYTGSGLRAGLIDQNGQGVRTRHDALQRPVEITNQDGTRLSIRYLSGEPRGCGISDTSQDFGGYCQATITKDETGIERARYTDALGRLRREVIAPGLLDYTTRFEYDALGRLTEVEAPSGVTTTYQYDPFGRVSGRRNANVGLVTFGYDRLGNLRVSQSEEQARRGALTFTEYDDLNRTTLVGEAEIEHAAPAGARLTDYVDATRLNHELGLDSIVTVNPTLFLRTVGPAVPRTWSYPAQVIAANGCALRPSTRLREWTAPVAPYLAHPYTHPEPITAPRASIRDFENVARYPHFVRTAISYDELPIRQGPVWQGLPHRSYWDSLAPNGCLRNTRGREAAIAWREHGGEAFNYAVISYDERGRIEALLRYTENLGFDAVYHSYNSLNLVTSVRTVDPLNQHTSWYGYDQNGRPDSVWTLLATGGGLGLGAPRRPEKSMRPVAADVVYTYTRTGRVASIAYPPAFASVTYNYSARAWIDSIVALRTAPGAPASPLFRQELMRDATGQITESRTQRGNGGRIVNRYSYDPARRLRAVADAAGATAWTLDRSGNRLLTTSPRGWIRTQYAYGPIGPDQLASTLSFDPLGSTRLTNYAHDPDGAVTSRTIVDSGATGMVRSPVETFTWSYRELLQRYTSNGTANDWRYRYSPAGEREQKRVFPTAPGHAWSDNENPWVYYLLGAEGEQLAEWHGREMNRSECNGSPLGSAWMYPVAYHSKGGGLTRIATRPDAVAPNGRKEFYVTDHLGSTRLVLAVGGVVVDELDYSPFGSPSMGPPATREAFTGRETDFENGLADHGVRKYDPAEGRFLSVDPRWEAAPGVSPYHYAHGDPLNRIDPNGRWDIVIHVSKDRSQNGYGVAVVYNRKGEEVYRFVVRLEGVGNRARYGSRTNPRNRMQQYGDTPLGVYDIPDGASKWIRGKSRTAYGPHPRLRLDPLSGEIVLSGRTDIRIHGGRQEMMKNGEYVAKDVPSLEKTHGCIRAFDDAMKKLKEVTDQLEAVDEEEEGGTLVIVDDLETLDGTPVPAVDLENGTGER